MILYHGSNQVIDKVNLLKSRPNKDFGRAFYLSDTFQQAEEMALFKSEVEGGTPVVNKFTFDENMMKSSSLRVLTFEEYSEEWARFVFANRDSANGEVLHDYDIVYGFAQVNGMGRQRQSYTLQTTTAATKEEIRITFAANQYGTAIQPG